MNEHKTPEQIARATPLPATWRAGVDMTDPLMQEIVAYGVAVIHAYRAQRSEPTDAQVLAALSALLPAVDWSAEAMGKANPTWIASMRAALRAANNVQEGS